MLSTDPAHATGSGQPRGGVVGDQLGAGALGDRQGLTEERLDLVVRRAEAAPAVGEQHQLPAEEQHGAAAAARVHRRGGDLLGAADVAHDDGEGGADEVDRGVRKDLGRAGQPPGERFEKREETRRRGAVFHQGRRLTEARERG